MKKSMFLLLSFVAFVFASCNKESFEMSPVQESANRTLLMAQPTPEIAAFTDFLSGTELKTKSAIVGGSASEVNVFPLDGRTIAFYNDRAVKYFLYVEKDNSNTRTKEFTISQTFQMKDGVIDTSHPLFEEKTIGCPFAKAYNLKERDNIVGITFHARFNNGIQYTYRSNYSNGRVMLDPLDGCVWQLSVAYNDGDMWQEYASEYIDYYNESQSEIFLRYEVRPVTTLSYTRIPSEYLKGAYMVEVVGINIETGEMASVWHDFMYDINLPTSVAFASPYNEVFTIRVYKTESILSYDVILAPSVVGSKGPKWYVTN